MEKVYFLIINEDLSSGLLQDQLVSPVKKHLLDKFEPIIINIHRIGKGKYTSDPKLKVINIPLLIPFRLFLFNIFFWLTPILAFFYAIVSTFIVKKDARIVARSYFPGLVSLIVNKIKSVEYVFDPRSLFIEEHSDRVKRVNRKMWKLFEKKILENSVRNISVSHYQMRYYQETSGINSKNIVVPCFYEIPEKLLSESERQRKRHELGLNDREIVVCYFGSLNSWWNNIDMYSDAFMDLSNNGFKVLIISQDHKSLNFNDSNIIVLNTSSMSNFDSIIQICDYGIVLLEKNNDWKTRLTVKFAAYTCNGIPTIIGQYVGEAVRITLEEKMSNNKIVDYRNVGKKVHDLISISQNERMKNIELGKRYFSTERIKQYLC